MCHDGERNTRVIDVEFKDGDFVSEVCMGETVSHINSKPRCSQVLMDALGKCLTGR